MILYLACFFFQFQWWLYQNFIYLFLSSCICANNSVLPLDKTYLVRFHSYQKEKLMANQKINRDVLFTLPVLNDTHFNGNSKFNKHLKIHLELLVSCDDKAFCWCQNFNSVFLYHHSFLITTQLSCLE